MPNLASRSATWALSTTITLLLAPVAMAERDPGAGARPAEAAAVPGEAPLVAVAWIDHIDTYVTDSQLHGQGGWTGWDGTAGTGAFAVNDQFRSDPNSIEILGASDLVHQYTGFVAGEGTWTYTAWQFIPTAATGQTYFILLNTFTQGCTGTPLCNWSTQVLFDLGTNQLGPDFGPCSGTATIVRNQWVEIRVDINLNADQQTFFYNGSQVFQCSWSAGASGGGVVNIAAVDLFANGATAVYYDDISLSALPFSDNFESGSTNNWHWTEP